MIPKILHQIWLGPNPIPKKFLEFQQNWRELHPDWSYKIWTDTAIRDIPIKHLVDRCGKFSSKSNMVRIYAVMFEGGVYADMDIDWNKNFDIFLTYKAFAAKESQDIYCNAIFGSEANSSWLSYQYNILEKYCSLPPPWGPKLMTLAVKNRGEKFTDIPTNFFYPFLWNCSKPLNKEDYSDSYCVHYWEKSWKR